MNSLFLKLVFVVLPIISFNSEGFWRNFTKDKYERLWEEVAKAESSALPRTALESVEVIYNLALKENNEQQIIKSTIYRMKYTNILEEDGYVKAIQKLESEIKELEGVPKALLHLLLANMYLEYYNANSWNINQRSVVFNYELSDIKTWDKTGFLNQIINHYLLALDDNLKGKSIDDYPEIVNINNSGKEFLPDLYDLVAQTIIQRIGNINRFSFYFGSRGSDSDRLKEAALLSSASTFVSLPIDADSLSLNYTCVKIYQKWLQYKLQNPEQIEAYVFADLSRLDFVHDNLVNNNKEKLWESRIKDLLSQYYNNPISVLITHKLASFYNTQGSKFQHLNVSTHTYKNSKSKAHKLLVDILEKFPKEYYSAECINLKNSIERQTISITNERINSPNANFPVMLSYGNIDKVYYTIYKLDYREFSESERSRSHVDNLRYIRRNGEPIVESKEIELINPGDFNPQSTELIINALDIGFYKIIFHLEPKIDPKNNLLAVSETFVSNLSITSNSENSENIGYYVLDRTSGQPIANARVVFYGEKYDYRQRAYVHEIISKGSTDNNGFIIYNPKNKRDYYNIKIDVQKKQDFISESVFSSRWRSNVETDRQEIKIFTDRAIYRPGQDIHFKGICIRNKGANSKITPNYSTTIFLRDVNNQEVASMQVKANEFGSFSGTFSIPLDVLTGVFRIETYGGRHSIRVEEYKRPMFEVLIDPVEGEYRLNDSVNISGKAVTYAGANLSNADVYYSVTRNAQWIRRWGWFGVSLPESEEVGFGNIKTDDQGKFEIDFKATAHTDGSITNDLYYIYTVSVHVTDINGETQSRSTSVSVSNTSLTLSSNIQNIEDKNKLDSLRIISNNISGMFVPADVEVEIHKLKEPEKLLAEKNWSPTSQKLYTKEQWYDKYPGYEYSDELNKRNWENENRVLRKKITTENNTKIPLKDIKSWNPGVYRITLKSQDKWGNDIEDIREFVLFDSKSEKMPYLTTDFFATSANSAQPGETVSIFIGSSYTDVNLFYQLSVQGKNRSTEFIKINNGVHRIDIPIKEIHRGGIAAHFMFIKKGRLYSFSHHISVAWLNKRLKLDLVTFRDKTLPGSEESWKIRISDFITDEKHEAELLAGMYDASLDVFASNHWSWSIMPHYYSFARWENNSFKNHGSFNVAQDFYPEHVRAFVSKSVPTFNMFGFSYHSYMYDRRRQARGVKAMASPLLEETEATGAVQYAVEVADAESTGETQQQDMPVNFATADRMEKPMDEIDVQIRSNFNETAFFYPHLQTDKNGEIHINFTVPESLTRWNFMGFAHSKDLKMGSMREEMITQKELMVSPNLPRFLRENDKMYISARISNVSAKEIGGKAKLEFYDPVSLKIINDKFEVNQSEVDFFVESGLNTSVSWEISIPEGLSMCGVRIVAVGEKHSDGEERIVPVLTNRTLVTETMPLPVRTAGTTNFTMERLLNSESSSTLRHHAVTLEFTSNPAWYAVQALPYLMEFPYDCAEQIFSRFYANSLATHIANSDPKIKRVFELWRDTPDSKALLSNLEKNQELKSLLLEETPWVMQAKNETERKRRIGLLFDLSKMNLEMRTALKQLSDMQKHNGGWPWFEGMPESWYITQHIVAGLGKLDRLGVQHIRSDRQTESMLKSAISFIDGELAREYSKLKLHCNSKCLKMDNLGYMQIHYLYARSFFTKDYPINSNAKEAYEYYLNQAEQYWTNKGFYMQGMIAIALNRYDNNSEAMKIIASIKEHALYHDELGMYWNINRGFYWHQAPIETHAMLMEAFEEVAKDIESVDDMKVWLLKQKQTQDWKTTKATVEAIYALIMRGTDILSNDEIAVVTLGDIVIDAQNDPEIKTEAGTGYFKKSWHGSDIKPEMGNVTVTKSTDDVAWGAVYWQYFEQLDKITHFEETPLKIDKKLFVQRRVGDARRIVPIEKDANLKVGDRVTVRIEIRVDRDMEYVHLKDMRASCFEPVDVISGYRWKHGLGYYQAIRDASMNFFINYLRKGTYVFEYDLVVSQKGEFSNGITTIQSMYAPEFTSHSEGVRVVVK